jgi:hypothetical protein
MMPRLLPARFILVRKLHFLWADSRKGLDFYQNY